jgi:amino acid permease
MQFISGMWVEMGGEAGGIMNTLVGDNKDVQQFATKVIFGGLALPLCFKRQLSELRFVSITVVLFCLLTSAVVCTKSLVEVGGGETHGAAFAAPKFVDLLTQVPTAAFGFSSIVELFHVRAEIKKPELMGRCVHIASTIIVVVYLSVGLIGALAFQNPGSDFLERFPDSHLVAILRLGIIIMITLLYPIINFPCVSAIGALPGNFAAPSMRAWRTMSVIGLCLVLFIDTSISLASTHGLDDVFGISGSLGLGLVAYTLPCAAFLAISLRARRDSPLPAHHAIAAGIILCLGLFMTIGSTAWIIRGIVCPKITVDSKEMCKWDQ